MLLKFLKGGNEYLLRTMTSNKDDTLSCYQIWQDVHHLHIFGLIHSIRFWAFYIQENLRNYICTNCLILQYFSKRKVVPDSIPAMGYFNENVPYCLEISFLRQLYWEFTNELPVLRFKSAALILQFQCIIFSQLIYCCEHQLLFCFLQNNPCGNSL